MKTLKEKFGELSAKIKASGQPARVWFPQYTPASLLSAENWWEALAVCEYALDTKEDEKLTEDFFELIFSAFDCNVEVELNAEEYEFWWEKVMQVCDRVAEFSGAGWAQKGAQYSEARYGKRDMSYLFPYYEKAADMGWAEAEATVAYWRYMGFYCEQDKEEGERRFAALPKLFYGESIIVLLPKNLQGIKQRHYRYGMNCLPNCLKVNVCVLMYMQRWGMRSTGRKVTWQRKLLITKKPWK